MEYGETHSAAETAIRYHVSKKTYYKWKKRWDGTRSSLEDRSRRPKRSPKGHSEEEIKKIKKRVKQCKWTDLILAYQLLTERDGYTRSYGGFKRVVRKLKGDKGKKRKARKNKPYEQAEYPGQKLQVDVKYVPTKCVADGEKYYQYTAVDEYSRWTYRQIYSEHSTYSSRNFLEKLIKNAPFKIKRIQTDNGSEFTNRPRTTRSEHLTLFESGLIEHGIEYQRIRIATPRHNGKVERQHRQDEERFFSRLRMYSLEDGRKQLAKYQRRSNKIIKTCLGMKSPNTVLREYEEGKVK